MKAALVLALIVLIAPASKSQLASDSTVFGLKLGAPLSIPECAHLNKKSDIYRGNDAAPCYERYIPAMRSAKSKTPVVNESISIVFPYASKPPLVSGLKFSGQVVNGNLESIGFNTAGISAQDRTLAALKEKYGEPNHIFTVKKGNAYGATFDSVVATWSVGDLSIVFQGTTNAFDSGMVNIDTSAGVAYREKSLAQLSGAKL